MQHDHLVLVFLVGLEFGLHTSTQMNTVHSNHTHNLSMRYMSILYIYVYVQPKRVKKQAN